MSVFGWGFFHTLLLHFALILTNHRFQLNKLSRAIILYLPSVINVILFAPFGFLAEKQYEMVPSDFGWVNMLPANIGQIWINVYYITYTVITIVLLIRWWREIEPDSPLKRQITHFLISMMFPFVAGSITDILPGMLGLEQRIPALAIPFMIPSTISLFITLRRFGLLLERKMEIPLLPEVGKSTDEERMRLFETAAAIFMIGAVGSLFSGYFIARESLVDELLLTAVVFSLGIFLRFIPLITKNHTEQNTLFLIASIIGMTFFIIKDIDKGAISVWAVYTIFLLYTVVLNSDRHVLFFLWVTLIIQVALWIAYPKVHAVVDNAQYLKRIFIIILSYAAVRYLTNEYSLKERGYELFAREQEILEKISSNFISVTTENMREKVDEMLVMAAEILEYDYANLIGFSSDYESATVLNVYAQDADIESLPYQPGMTVKTPPLPMNMSLITQQQPVFCEDVEKIPTTDGEEEKNFFASRGINSYFALPIIVDGKTIGIFIVEYRDRSEESSREARLYFLRIIANILGDTKKKTLYEERLYKFAYFDENTKLANRNMLRRKIEQTLQNRNELEKVAILNIELDNLRMINDTFGHAVGEQIVVKSASIIKNMVQECCIVSRVGEGKLVVVMPQVENIKQVEERARRIIDAFSNPILPQQGIESLFVTVSIGISMYPDDGRDADTLLKNSDLAGYEAKNSIPRIVFCSEQLKNRITETTLLTNQLFRALQKKEFSLEFQPQISCNTGKTAGAEALLRWTTADNKRIPPDIFIPILEQTGLIHDVGYWVLEQALQEHNRLISKGFPPLRFSVNLSIVQFKKEDFIPNVSRIIAQSRANPKCIELEITESMLSQNFAETIGQLSQLKDLGVNIAIDDFGRGYSSLHRLGLVPFSRIKIDKSIIDNVTTKSKEAAIAKVIVTLSRNLGADITAEGVETKEQVDFMKSLACDEIQGYYFSKPLPPDVLEEFLKKNGDR